MDKNYLDKVLNQIVRETSLDYDQDIIYVPFFNPSLPFISFFSHSFFHQSFFNNHCREVYGLNYDEIEYVWNEYEHIVKDKIRNNL